MKSHMEMAAFAYLIFGLIGSVLCIIRFALLMREQHREWCSDAVRGFMLEDRSRGNKSGYLGIRPSREHEPIHGGEAIKYGGQVYKSKLREASDQVP